MARHLRGVLNADQIAHINHRHVTAEKLEAATRDIIDRFHRFTLPHYWGDEKRVAADGTHYELAEENLLVERHIRYGGYGGIAYHHGSDMYILLFAKILTTGLSIGSGGSGGIFGPGMVIGGILGALVWRLCHHVLPGVPDSPSP